LRERHHRRQSQRSRPPAQVGEEQREGDADGHRDRERVRVGEGHDPRDRARGQQPPASPRAVLVRHRPPPERRDDQEQRQAEQERALGHEHRDREIAPAQRPRRQDRVVVSRPAQQTDKAVPGGVHVADQPEESDTSARDHEQRGEHRGQAVPADAQREPVQQADERPAEHQVLELEGATRARPRRHQHGRDEVDHERIGQPRARELGMFRREVTAVQERRRDGEVERQIAQVVVHPGEYSTAFR
jgi:hypothetical protein